jgi:primosomal protein N' (replication factor Y)
MNYDVLVSGIFDQTFTYSHDIPLAIGQLVLVPFGAKELIGAVISPSESHYEGTIKAVNAALPLILNPATIQFAQWVAAYNFIPRGMVLRMTCPFTPAEILKDTAVHAPHFTLSAANLNAQQQDAVETMTRYLGAFQPILLDGVTGSGKTNVYFEAAAKALSLGKQVLVLLPEIGLTKQWIDRFTQHFGAKPFVWHSHITKKQKLSVWHWALSGQPGIVVGARSCLFLPFANLGLMCVDEEHDASYKQEEQGCYHARDMAVVKAKFAHCPIVLSSATPSLETMENVHSHKYVHCQLTERFAAASFPAVHVISTQKMKADEWISPALDKAITQRLERSEQTLLFLNRRGYAPLLLCRSCGHRFHCPGCDTTLVLHRHNSQLLCHHCGFHKPAPAHCPGCHNPEDTLIPCGPGVERIKEVVQARYPTARVHVITSDLMTTPDQMNSALTAIEHNACDIIIGTQMLAKGHNFPHLTLIGVIDADAGLNGSDMRAAERTYQMTHQVIGRVGRFEKNGEVYIQTFFPEHPLMQALKNHDRDGFYALEREERSLHQMPPFAKLGAIILSGLNKDTVQKAAYTLARNIPRGQENHITVLGPVPAPLARIRSRYRWRFLIRAQVKTPLHAFIKSWLESTRLPSTVRLTLDIDPQSFL